jgi:hypothetical protein
MKALWIIIPTISLLLATIATQSIRALYEPGVHILGGTFYLFWAWTRIGWRSFAPHRSLGPPITLILLCSALFFSLVIENLHRRTIYSVFAERANACVLIVFFLFVATWILIKQRRINREAQRDGSRFISTDEK